MKRFYKLIKIKSFKKIIKAEQNIIKVIDLDFNSIELPYTYYQKINLSGINSQSYELSRIITLDMHRAGITLFYKSLYITISSIVLGNFFVTGNFVPGYEKNEDIYDNKNINDNDKNNPQIKKGVFLKGMPLCFMIKAPSYDKEILAETLNSEEDKKNSELFDNKEEEEFIKWLKKCCPESKKIKLNKIYGSLIRNYSNAFRYI